MRLPQRLSAAVLLTALTAGPGFELLPSAGAITPNWANVSTEVFIARVSTKHKDTAKNKEPEQLIACIAKRPATARQRRIALMRAKRAYKRMTAARRAAARRRSRYLAIQTERDAQAKGAITCMVFDTRTMQIVGEKVYDCETEPPIGTGLKFESFVATYVGS